jgi:hypothetical protein
VVDEPALEGPEETDPLKILPHACFLLPVSPDGCVVLAGLAPPNLRFILVIQFMQLRFNLSKIVNVTHVVTLSKQIKYTLQTSELNPRVQNKCK